MIADLRVGDSLQVLKTLEDNSVDSVVTDPPYGLSFMGKQWDYDVPSVEMWKEVIRVLKPGGHLLSFSSARTYHRMAVAVEDAGFEIRDQIMWVYGSGFPKSHNIGKSYDKKMGNLRESLGENPNKKGRVNNSSGQFAGAVDDDWKPREVIGTKADFAKDGAKRKSDNHQSMQDTMNADIKVGYKEGWGTQVTKGFSKYEGWGTQLKPSHEPIVLARKPLSEKTIVDNVIKHGTGGINIDKSRVDTDDVRQGGGSPDRSADKSTNFGVGPKKVLTDGRFPANFIHDGSEEVIEHFPDTKSTKRGTHLKNERKINNAYRLMEDSTYPEGSTYGDEGSAARFFYCAKVSKAERNAGCESIPVTELKGRDEGQDAMNSPQKLRPTTQANNHPTVKPVKLMTYLVNLITPEGGTVLDPFMGSGSTGMAATAEGFNFIGIDLDETYVKIADARIQAYDNEQQDNGKETTRRIQTRLWS